MTPHLRALAATILEDRYPRDMLLYTHRTGLKLLLTARIQNDRINQVKLPNQSALGKYSVYQGGSHRNAPRFHGKPGKRSSKLHSGYTTTLQIAAIFEDQFGRYLPAQGAVRVVHQHLQTGVDRG